MTRILLIDDDSQLVALLSEYLTRDGFSVTTARDGVVGAAEARPAGGLCVEIVLPWPRNQAASHPERPQ
jgi:DNA-binding response OmpR family regulator